MHIPIQLKFGFSGPKANICTNFSENPINIHRVTRCFKRKANCSF